MEIKITIDETKIKYRQPKSLIEKVGAELGNWLRKVSLMILVNPPYEYKGIKKWFSILRFDQIGKTIRIEPQTIEEEFLVHNERLKLYNSLSTLIFFTVAIVMTLLITGIFIFTSVTIQSAPLKTLVTGSFNVVSGLLGILLAVLSARIASILLDKRFADSLILASSLYLVIDLQKYDKLSNPDFKRSILERIRILRRNIILLSQTFVDSNLAGNKEAISQLRSIEAFIHERESWVITPKKNSLELLRKDFDKLALILISGQYGEFKSKKKIIVREVAPTPLTFADKILQAIFFLFPYGLILVLYFKPEFISNLGLNYTTVFLVIIAWILLTIDIRLKLGFVERVADLAKTMKELR